ncbi:TVP38/TMEM64 family protein [Paenibacillus selenitireducens]|uniref:TVP38/TMEM64 family protein n=1 Tax=Paenibacillus selenitireducens TaxID=1324314 RepID=UPI000996DE60|nr:TVP38/TMEM64 family protein [Paenibacillus selenitireducens]
MNISDIISLISDGNWIELLERYRSLGPLPGILLTFMKSFVPPLPTIVLVGGNAAVYGFWLGFLYSWIGLVSGCVLTFLIVRKIASSQYVQRWATKPKVQKSMIWVRRNAFSYVFILSVFPVGPFVMVNMAAGAVRMSFRSFLFAVGMGKAIMVLMVSYIGYDLGRFAERPYEIVYVVLFVAASLWASKKIEKRFTRVHPVGTAVTDPISAERSEIIQ